MGKTLGFGVPLLQRLALDEAVVADDEGQLPAGRAPRALVMVPTRELCVQVTRDLHQVGKYLGLAVTSVYGGRAYEPQISALQAGVDLVVGTPGRLLDLANGRHLVLGGSRCWCWTRPTRCWISASCPTWNACWRWCPPSSRQCCSRYHARPDPHAGQDVHVAAHAHPRGTRRGRRDPHPHQQYVYRAHAMDKVEMLARVLQARIAA